MAGAHQKLDKTLARVAELAAVFETAEAAIQKGIDTCKTAEQVKEAVRGVSNELNALMFEVTKASSSLIRRCADLEKAAKSAGSALYPSRVEAWIDRLSVGVFAALAVLVIQYLVSVVRNLL